VRQLVEIGHYPYVILAPPPKQTLKEQKMSLEVIRILKASQNAQFVGGHIGQFPALDNMAERGNGD
jgi:hypothetical protein